MTEDVSLRPCEVPGCPRPARARPPLLCCVEHLGWYVVEGERRFGIYGDAGLRHMESILATGEQAFEVIRGRLPKGTQK